MYFIDIDPISNKGPYLFYLEKKAPAVGEQKTILEISTNLWNYGYEYTQKQGVCIELSCSPRGDIIVIIIVEVVSIREKFHDCVVAACC